MAAAWKKCFQHHKYVKVALWKKWKKWPVQCTETIEGLLYVRVVIITVAGVTQKRVKLNIISVCDDSHEWRKFKVNRILQKNDTYIYVFCYDCRLPEKKLQYEKMVKLCNTFCILKFCETFGIKFCFIFKYWQIINI